MHRPHDAGQRQLMTASVRLPIEVPNSRAEIGSAHVLNSSHSQISYAVFCMKKKKRSIPHESSYKNNTLCYASTATNDKLTIERTRHASISSRADTGETQVVSQIDIWSKHCR